MAETNPFPGRARHSRDGAHRPHPQSINVLGGFKTQGRVKDEWAAIEEDARLVAEAGAFSIVLEAMAEELARKITAAIPIPTIGIGASAGCDGQIL